MPEEHDEPKRRAKGMISDLPPEKRERFAGVFAPLLDTFREMNHVSVTVRCGKCGRVVMRATAVGSDRLRGKLACKEHGPVAHEITMAELHAEWTRRNKPASFGIKRNPLK